MVYLRTDGETFAYKMKASEVVTPSDVHVVRDDALDRNQLALMTCTPVGTTLNRLIVYAERIAVSQPQ
jgi:LPXTG-site transpeptidase (sortase) family protein